MNPFATHQRMLVKYLMRTTGPIVEIGCGDYSTPLIHEIASAQGRTVLTLESNAEWLHRFSNYKTDWHSLKYVESWDNWHPEGQYGLAFIDHTPGNRRPIEYLKLRDITDILILHDTEARGYDWHAIYPHMDHIETDANTKPSTTVLRGLNSSVQFPDVATPWRNHWTLGLRYLVVVPTHRLDVAKSTIDLLEKSLTYPTEFHVLDGSKGKCHAINAAMVDRLRLGTHDIYCTVDDDIIMSPNWQHFIACAFDRITNLGVCGIDYRGSEVGELLMSAAINVPIARVADIEFRDCTGVQNVAGGCMAMPAAVAKKVGPFPLADDGRIYHVEEDAWRCHRAITLGYRIGYVSNPNGTIELLSHPNDKQYMSRKQDDIANWKRNRKS